MTNQTTHHTQRTDRRTVADWPLYAAVSTGLALVLTAIGTFWSPLSSYPGGRFEDEIVPWLAMNVPLVLVCAGVVFGLVVRTAPADGGRIRTVVLAVLAVLSLAVFWTGWPVVFGAGAACCALADPRSMRSRTSLVLVALVTAVAVWAALAG